MTINRDKDLGELTSAVLKRIGVEGLELPVANDRGETQVVTRRCTTRACRPSFAG